MAEDFSEEDSDLEIEGDAFADEDISGEEWDDLEDSGTDSEMRAPLKKKKSSLFSIVAIGGGIVAVVAVLFLQFGGGSSQPQQQQKSAALPPRGAVDTDSVMSQAPAPAPGYALPEQSSITSPPQDKEAKRAAIEQASKPPSSGFLGDPSSLSDVETMRGQVEFEEYADSQSSGSRLMPQVVEPDSMPPMPAPLEQAESSVSTPEDPGALTPLPRRTDDFKRQDGGLDGSVARTASGGTDKSQDMSEMVARMDGLLERMDQMERTLALVQDGKTAAIEKMSARIDKMEKRTSSAASPPKNTAVSGDRESPAESAPLSSSWVLKSAQPDKAIVAKKGESEVYAVAVGDTLAGIGRIESIGMDSGLWVVR
ncbi:MAG: hypothetical protein HY370_07610, partial [Proteobacteria bacterium]|nr:hypothetical protein [Pseudomonadota bacterium]